MPYIFFMAQKFFRYSIAVLLFIVAVNAFAGGYYGMAGAKNVPVEWLQDTPFHSYFIPALILFVIVGGCSLLGALAVIMHHRFAFKAAVLSGLVILAWINVQLLMIGYVSWLQPAIAVAGFLVLILSVFGLEYLRKTK